MGIFTKKKKVLQGVALVKIPESNPEKPFPETRTKQYEWYLAAYQDLPLINAIVNVQTDQVVQDFYFEGPNKEKLTEWADLINLMQFFHQTTKNMLIFGNAYVEVVKEGDTISKLKILNPIWIDVYRNKLGKIMGYSQIIENRKLVLWGTTGNKRTDSTFVKKYPKIDTIVHFKYNVVGSEKYGNSVISPLVLGIQSKLKMESSLGELLKKYVAPLIHATVGSDEMPAQDDVVDDVATVIRDLHAESEIVTTHLVKLDVLDFNKKGMDIATPITHIDQQIVTGGQVPPVLLGKSDNASDKAADVQLRNFGRHIRSIQREVKIEFEDKIIVGQDLGSFEDKLIWEQAEEREREIETDILRGLVTDGIITPQKANDLLPPKFRETLPEVPDPMDLLNQNATGPNGVQTPRGNQMKSKKVTDNPNDPTQSTKNPNAKGRVNKADRAPTAKDRKAK